MKLTRSSISRRIKRFEDAHDEYLFRGAGDPDFKEAIEENYKNERERLIRYIIEIAFAFGEKPSSERK